MPVVFASGTMTALAGGTVTYSPFLGVLDSEYADFLQPVVDVNVSNGAELLFIYTMDVSTCGIDQRTLLPTDTLNLTGATLTVVPEPASVCLLGLAAGAVLRRRRRTRG